MVVYIILIKVVLWIQFGISTFLKNLSTTNSILIYMAGIIIFLLTALILFFTYRRHVRDAKKKN